MIRADNIKIAGDKQNGKEDNAKNKNCEKYCTIILSVL